MRDGSVERSAAIGEEGQIAISLTPDTGGTRVLIFENSQLEGSHVGDLLWSKDSKRGHPAPSAALLFLILFIRLQQRQPELGVSPEGF